MASPVLSIVAPAYNEERNIPAFLAAIIPVLEGIGETFEIIFVNDGSRDGTLGMLAGAASQDPRIKVIGLSRNFGKDIALSAGLAHATGQAVIPIDCDLQHPPELIPAFVAKWREGYDMVLGVRSKRDEEGYVRRTLSRTYYKVMRFMTSVEIPPNAGDFRLLDRKILDVINKMPERHRFMKGIFAWPGFRVASIEFQANVRANETQSTWSFFKLWRFALDGLFSFSTAPLKLWTYIGALSAGGAFLYLLITIIQKLFWGITVPGYASLLIVLLFFNGLLLISNGIQGEYIARIFEEVKGRPLYVVGQAFGFDAATLAAAATRAAVPAMLPASGTAPHFAPPPPNPNNATQIGLATGPQPPPTYAPPLPIPPSGSHAAQPSVFARPPSSPGIAPSGSHAAIPPSGSHAAIPPSGSHAAIPPSGSHAAQPPRTSAPMPPPSIIGDPTGARARAPSSPPVAIPRTRTPSGPPPVAAAPAVPQSAHDARTAPHGSAPSTDSSRSRTASVAPPIASEPRPRSASVAPPIATEPRPRSSSVAPPIGGEPRPQASVAPAGEPRPRTPSSAPIGNEPRARTPSGAPTGEPRPLPGVAPIASPALPSAAPPSAAPPVAAPSAGLHDASSPNPTAIDPIAADTVPTEASPATPPPTPGERRPRHELPKPTKGPPPPRS